MGAVWYRFAAELRTRWRSWLGLAVLVGLFYGAVLAALVGAQRTNTVVARSVRHKPAADVYMVPAYSRNSELLDFDKIAAFPEVADALRVPAFPNAEDWDVDGVGDAEEIARSSRLLAGRLPRAGAADEVVANVVAREKRHVSVGQTVELHLGAAGDYGDGDPPPGPAARVKVVGVIASLGDFVTAAGPGLFVTPAFVDAYQGRAATFDIYAFMLEHRDADLPAFRRHMSNLTGGKSVLFVEGRNDWVQTQRSFHVQAVSLLLLAAFVGLVAFLVLSQTLVRLGFLESVDHETLFALGMTRAQRLALAASRGILIGAVAVTIAVTAAVAASWAMPFGRPRLAEVSPGLWAPGVLLVVSGVVIFTIVVAQSTLTAWAGRRGRVTRSVFADRVAAVVPGASAGVGVRFALEPGRGTDAVPVRSTFVAATLGVLAVVMALTVSASLGHLLDTPGLYGWGWDAAADVSDGGPPDARARLEQLPGVAAVGYGTLSGEAAIGPVSADVISMEPGPVAPVTLSGRAPLRDDEIALARKTLRRAHAHIGSSVPVTMQGQSLTHQMRVVGVVVLPVESDISTLGEGALVSGKGMRRFIPEAAPDTAFVRYSRGANVVRTNQAVAAVVGQDRLQLPSKPTSLVDFGRVRSLPYVLAGILAVLAVATVAHLVLSSVRRRRHDLALLKTIGFVSGQLRAVAVWQALTLTVVSLAVGLPLGIACGRWIWLLFANDVGFLGKAVSEPVPLAIVGAAAVALSSVIAWAAGRGAARTPAAVVLRSE